MPMEVSCRAYFRLATVLTSVAGRSLPSARQEWQTLFCPWCLLVSYLLIAFSA